MVVGWGLGGVDMYGGGGGREGFLGGGRKGDACG